MVGSTGVLLCSRHIHKHPPTPNTHFDPHTPLWSRIIVPILKGKPTLWDQVSGLSDLVSWGQSQDISPSFPTPAFPHHYFLFMLLAECSVLPPLFDTLLPHSVYITRREIREWWRGRPRQPLPWPTSSQGPPRSLRFFFYNRQKESVLLIVSHFFPCAFHHLVNILI